MKQRHSNMMVYFTSKHLGSSKKLIHIVVTATKNMHGARNMYAVIPSAFYFPLEKTKQEAAMRNKLREKPISPMALSKTEISTPKIAKEYMEILDIFIFEKQMQAHRTSKSITSMVL